eukprot:767098-Hanusia_phi.AAC.1
MVKGGTRWRRLVLVLLPGGSSARWGRGEGERREDEERGRGRGGRRGELSVQAALLCRPVRVKDSDEAALPLQWQ